MTTQETLKSRETFTSSSKESQAVYPAITKEEVLAIYTERKKHLNEVRSIICLKFYNAIDEKLENEKRQFEQLLNFQDAREEALSHYSFVLNPCYFEQKFINV